LEGRCDTLSPPPFKLIFFIYTYVKEKKMKNKICSFPSCKKKIHLICFDCTCNKSFCLDHRFPEIHRCSEILNIKKNEKEILNKKLLEQESSFKKIQKI
tara:strand:+ start:622 stop:918 length:297 start_codon:yes stop_codon:yes gene_type:complete